MTRNYFIYYSGKICFKTYEHCQSYGILFFMWSSPTSRIPSLCNNFFTIRRKSNSTILSTLYSVLSNVEGDSPENHMYTRHIGNSVINVVFMTASSVLVGKWTP